MRTRNWLIVAVVALCTVTAGARVASDPDPAAAAAPGGQTVKKSIWGAPSVEGKNLFPLYRDAGVGIYNVDLRWYLTAPTTRPANATDPTDPAYQWPAELSAAIDNAGTYGMQVAIRIIGTPRWANGNHNPRFVPTNPQDFADFAVATSKRFPNVRLWIVWGEPSREANFGPLTPAKSFKGPLTPAQQVAPHNYAQLLDTAYGALKAANPANLVVGGNTFNSAGASLIHPYQWIRYMTLPDGSRPRMDMYGHNPFTYAKPSLHAKPSPGGRIDFNDLPYLMKALDRTFPGAPLPLFLEEFGVQGGSREGAGLTVNLKTQAKWIRAAYRIARNTDRIYSLGWVHALDSAVSPSGLLDVHGRPKPAYYVFKSS